MGFTVTRTDRGLKRVISEASALGRIRIKAGSLGGLRDTGESLPGILAIHEFGGGNVPARSPIKKGLAKAQAKIRRQFASGAKKINAGSESAGTVADALADVAVEAIRDGIMSNLPPPLAESTLNREGRDPRGIALLDTGQLIDSIEAEVSIK